MIDTAIHDMHVGSVAEPDTNLLRDEVAVCDLCLTVASDEVEIGCREVGAPIAQAVVKGIGVEMDNPSPSLQESQVIIVVRMHDVWSHHHLVREIGQVRAKIDRAAVERSVGPAKTAP